MLAGRVTLNFALVTGPVFFGLSFALGSTTGSGCTSNTAWMSGVEKSSLVGLSTSVPVTVNSTVVPSWPPIGKIALMRGAGIGTPGCWAESMAADATKNNGATRAKVRRMNDPSRDGWAEGKSRGRRTNGFAGVGRTVNRRAGRVKWLWLPGCFNGF